VSDAASDALVVVTSAGNEGSGGEDDYATVGSPGTAAGAITVGATTNNRSIGFPVKVTDGNDDTSEFDAAVGDFDPFAETPVTGADFVLWPDQADVDGDGEDEGLACTGTTQDLTDKVALIDRGACAFSQKVANAKAAGAAGVVVANNVPGDGPIAMAASSGYEDDLAAVGISYESGQAIRGLDESWTVTINGNFLEMSEVDANDVASFSSRGPAPFTWLAKPDIGAPGVNIRSSVFDGGYAQFQGTSMASPHVAGAAALVIAADGSLAPWEVKGKLVAAAARPGPLVDESVLDRGNGLLDVAGAIAQGAWADPVSVSFGKFTGGAPVSGSVALEFSDESCTVTGGTTAEVGYADGMATLDAGRAPSGEYEGEFSVACGGESFTVPWWYHIDRRGQG
jgi:minor extracellular serine protease Vpr